MYATDDQRPAWTYPLLAAGVLSFASSAILIRYADSAPGLAVAVFRTAIAVLILAPAGLRATWREWRPVVWKDVGLVLLAGALLGLHFVAWISSVYLTTIASSAVLVTTGPIFLAALGFLVLGERLEPRVILSILIAVAGAAVLAIGESAGEAAPGRNPALGNALALFAAMVWAVYLLIGRVVRQRLGWFAYVFPLYVVAALLAITAAVAADVRLTGYDLSIYGLCALMAIFPQILGHGSFNFAVKYFPAALLGLLSLLEPIGASVFAAVLFGEVPGRLAIAGMVMILMAVALTVVRRPRAVPVTD
jgi:drug/metabolite transporter (DMT)-like permease